MQAIKHILLYSILLLTLSSMWSCKKEEAVAEGDRPVILFFSEFHRHEQTGMTFDKAMMDEFDESKYEVLTWSPARESFQRIYAPCYIEFQFDMFTQFIPRVQKEPDIVVLVGDLMAQTAARYDHPWFREKPVLCIDILYPEWSGELAKHKNFVIMEAKSEPKKNIDFIRANGGSSWVITVIDSTFLDEKLRSSILEQMGDDTAHYATNLRLETIDRLVGWGMDREENKTTIIPINMELTSGVPADSVHNGHFRIPGIFKIRNNVSTFLRLKDDAFIDKAFTHSLGPYYSQTPKYFNQPLQTAMSTCIGGYMTPWPEAAKQIHPIVDQLLAGVPPESFPQMTLKKDYWMDWRMAKYIHPYAEDFPKEVNFVNLPWEDRSRFARAVHDFWLPVMCILIILLVIGVPIYLTLRSRYLHNQLVGLGKQAATNRQQIEDILAAAHAYRWRLEEGNIIRLDKKFAVHIGIRSNCIPLEQLLNMLSAGADELREAILHPKEQHVILDNIVAIDRKGKTHAFLCHINQMPDGKGGTTTMGFIVLNNESYEVKKRTEEAYQLAEEASVKASFLAAMGHEIRSPLNAIVGFSDLLVKHNKELSLEEREAFIQHINDSKDQLLKLLDDVMNYSTKKEESFTLELSKKSVKELMDEAYYMHTVIVPQPLEFRYECGPELHVMANRSAILQIISNLMNNAIKFTPKGHITLGWKAADDADGQWVMLYVEDSGSGISESNKQLIFKKFSKVDTHSVGAGIGLALCMQLAQSMHGTISVESEVGKGSTFSLKLPIEKA